MRHHPSVRLMLIALTVGLVVAWLASAPPVGSTPRPGTDFPVPPPPGADPAQTLVRYLYDTDAGQAVFLVRGQPRPVPAWGHFSGVACADSACSAYTFWISGDPRAVRINGVLIDVSAHTWLWLPMVAAP